MAVRMPASCKGISSSAHGQYATLLAINVRVTVHSCASSYARQAAPCRSSSHPQVVQLDTKSWRLHAAAPVSSQPVDTTTTYSASQPSLSSYEDPYTFVPEDYELPAGVLSIVDRTSPPAPEDAYRCTGCTRPECQVSLYAISVPGDCCQEQLTRFSSLETWSVCGCQAATRQPKNHVM